METVTNLLTKTRLSVLLALCILLSGMQAISGKQPCTPTRDARVLKKREDQLRATAEKLLKVFRTGDTQAFFVLVHEKYFGMGEDGRNYTLRDLREAFRRKDEMYCYLFDTGCITPLPPPATGKELSFHEVAKRSGAKVSHVEVWATEGLKKPGCSGHVNFMWPAKLGEEFTLNVSRFTFMYVGGQWKTVGFAEPPIVVVEKKAPR